MHSQLFRKVISALSMIVGTYFLFSEDANAIVYACIFIVAGLLLLPRTN